MKLKKQVSKVQQNFWTTISSNSTAICLGFDCFWYCQINWHQCQKYQHAILKITATVSCWMWAANSFWWWCWCHWAWPLFLLHDFYFGAKRIRGKRGRGAGGKTIVFGVLKRGDKVYTEIVPDASKATLQKVIRGHISIESVINTDGWRGYHGLIDMGFAKHFRVYHGQNEFARGAQHINGIESFWSYAKHHLIHNMV